ncbi:MAG: ribosome biogenesis GTPase YlqF [Christensenellaceae bacterium]|nr:ribosome biogenesis GTPase YlqF [Christensenellaceae bacterium]
MNINWYPGHMTKARRALAEKTKMIELVIEVVDARAPLSSINPDFDDLLEGKRRMMILNKADMADAAITKRWLEYFRGKGIFAVSYSAIKGNPRQLQKQIEQCAQPIYDKYKEKGMNKTVRALICGIPNVGKSAILNRLMGTRKMKEGNKPGVTRGLAWAKLTPYLEIMDSPGLLWPKIEDEEAGAAIALIGSIRLEVLDEEQLAFYLLKKLRVTAGELLKERYRLTELPEDAWELMEAICRKRGFLLRGGEVDTERGTRMVLEEFRNAKIGAISLEAPPKEEMEEDE